MQCATLAQLITDTLAGLGYPDKKWLEIDDCARAVVHSIALVKQFSFSTQHLDIHTYEWDAAERDESLLALDAAIPLWVERKVSTDYWEFVPVCNLAVLEDARLRGDFRCAFYTEDGQLKIRFSYTPTDLAYATHKLRYESSVFIGDTFNDLVLDAQGTGLSSNFFPYITALAELEVIPTMRIKAAQEQTPNMVLINAWTARESYLRTKVVVWKDRFDHYVYGQRGAARGRRRRSILGGSQ